MTISDAISLILLYLCGGSLFCGACLAVIPPADTKEKEAAKAIAFTWLWLPLTFVVLGYGMGIAFRRSFRRNS